MAFTTLIDTATLAAHLDDPSFAIVDCRMKLDDVGWGEREYAAAHVPGAIYAQLDRDLSGPKNGSNGRHPRPEAAALAATFGAWGIADGVQVVAYDQDNGSFAARLWWLLRWLGHDAAAVLDGGFARWQAEARPTRNGVESRRRTTFAARVRPELMADLDRVKELVGRREWRLLDARAPKRYRGEVEPLDKTPGHIPGASNYFYLSNMNGAGTFRSREELHTQLTAALGGTPVDHVVCYCGSGVTACHNLLALEHAGLRGARLYVGSWSEWSSDPSRPVERS